MYGHNRYRSVITPLLESAAFWSIDWSLILVNFLVRSESLNELNGSIRFSSIRASAKIKSIAYISASAVEQEENSGSRVVFIG